MRFVYCLCRRILFSMNGWRIIHHTWYCMCIHGEQKTAKKKRRGGERCDAYASFIKAHASSKYTRHSSKLLFNQLHSYFSLSFWLLFIAVAVNIYLSLVSHQVSAVAISIVFLDPHSPEKQRDSFLSQSLSPSLSLPRPVSLEVAVVFRAADLNWIPAECARARVSAFTSLSPLLYLHGDSLHWVMSGGLCSLSQLFQVTAFSPPSLPLHCPSYRTSKLSHRRRFILLSRVDLFRGFERGRRKRTQAANLALPWRAMRGREAKQEETDTHTHTQVHHRNRNWPVRRFVLFIILSTFSLAFFSSSSWSNDTLLACASLCDIFFPLSLALFQANRCIAPCIMCPSFTCIEAAFFPLLYILPSIFVFMCDRLQLRSGFHEGSAKLSFFFLSLSLSYSFSCTTHTCTKKTTYGVWGWTADSFYTNQWTQTHIWQETFSSFFFFTRSTGSMI